MGVNAICGPTAHLQKKRLRRKRVLGRLVRSSHKRREL